MWELAAGDVMKPSNFEGSADPVANCNLNHPQTEPSYAETKMHFHKMYLS